MVFAKKIWNRGKWLGIDLLKGTANQAQILSKLGGCAIWQAYKQRLSRFRFFKIYFDWKTFENNALNCIYYL